MSELNQLWEGSWKVGAIESSKRRYELKEIYPKITSNSDLLKYFILAHIYNLSTAELLKSEISLIKAFEQKEFGRPQLYIVNYFKEYFSDTFLEMLEDLKLEDFSEIWSFAQLEQSYTHFTALHWSELRKGLKMLEGVRPVLFIRRDRRYKGRIVLINDQGELEQENGKVWSIEALAKGRVNKKFFLPNGDTPTGLYRIDSVMPQADHQNIFGKHRRLKIEFVERKLIEEKFSKEVLSHQWWRSGVIASELSRSLLRIHGTGLRNINLCSKHYPFVTTSGCVSLREDRKVEGQRVLLDRLMKSIKLMPSFSNEEKIYGHLCVIELDDKSSSVSLEDIIELGQ